MQTFFNCNTIYVSCYLSVVQYFYYKNSVFCHLKSPGVNFWLMTCISFKVTSILKQFHNIFLCSTSTLNKINMLEASTFFKLASCCADQNCPSPGWVAPHFCYRRVYVLRGPCAGGFSRGSLRGTGVADTNSHLCVAQGGYRDTEHIIYFSGSAIIFMCINTTNSCM